MTVQKVLSLIALVALLVGCQKSDPIETPSPEASAPSPVGSIAETPGSACKHDIPFEVTYLPDGFRRRVFEGRAHGSSRPDQEGQVIVHLRGMGSRAIEIRRPGTFFSELAQRDDAPTIEVLGGETAGFAPISPGGDDYIVLFTYPVGAKSTNHCAIYSLNEYGVPLQELKKVAEGLRPRD